MSALPPLTRSQRALLAGALLALVLAAIRQAESECDVIVLAQGSMAALLPELAGIRKPVLTSPRLAVERAREMLRA